MPYKIELKRNAVKQLAKLARRIQVKIREQVNKLERDPRPAGVKKLSSDDSIYRIKVSKEYRIVYQIRDDRLIVLVIKIGHRKDIYRYQ
ncbi:MAG: type II toxin-antitoxin system RelE/ParE family toxin [Proteobacteria bacterium]|nr:type II toxin-antitoxin system RelE/ParE family toxin [Pseudomonadota bacterium]